jgi:hypothetical protein
VSIPKGGRIVVVMDVSIMKDVMIQDVLSTEIASLEKWVRQPRIAVIARILR